MAMVVYKPAELYFAESFTSPGSQINHWAPITLLVEVLAATSRGPMWRRVNTPGDKIKTQKF